MAQVAVEFTGNVQALENALHRAEAKVQSLEARLKDVGRSGKKAGEDASSTGDAIAKAFDPAPLLRWSGVFAAGSALMMGLKLVRAELDKILELQARAAATQITVQSARAGVIRNLGAVDQATVRKVLESGASISKSAGVGEVFVQTAMASALSASGGNIEAATKAVRGSASLLADVPEAIADFAGALLDLSKVTGTIDAEVNRGFLGQIAAISRVTDPKEQAKSIPRSLIGQKAFGATPAEAASLFTALTVGAGDVEGRTSGTAAISLSQQVKEFFDAMAPAFGPEVAAQMGGMSMGQRIASLQSSPGLARSFLSKASFEKVALGPIVQLLTDPNSGVAKMFAANIGQFGDTETMRQTAVTMTRNMSVDPLSANAARSRVYKVGEESLLLQDLVSAEGAINREGLKKTLAATGTSAFTDSMISAKFEAYSGLGTRGGSMAAEDILNDVANDFASPRTGYRFRKPQNWLEWMIPPMAGGAEEMVTMPATTESMGQATILREIANELRRIRELNEDIKRTNSSMERRRPGGLSLLPVPAIPGADIY